MSTQPVKCSRCEAECSRDTPIINLVGRHSRYNLCLRCIDSVAEIALDNPFKQVAEEPKDEC